MTETKYPGPFPSPSVGSRVFLGIVTTLVAATAVPLAHASAIADGSLKLASLTITPARGHLVFSPDGATLVSAQNSMGDFDSSAGNGRIVTSIADVPWADAFVSVNSPSEVAGVTADSNIPAGMNGSANSFGFGVISDFSVSIEGTTGSVSVGFSAILPYMQLLVTGTSATASSGLTFLLSVDSTSVLSGQSAYSIGPNSVVFTSGSWDLNNSITLMADQTYRFKLMLVGSSNTTVVPEPTTLWLFLAGGVPAAILRRIS